MNNEQFRRLVLDQPGKKRPSDNNNNLETEQDHNIGSSRNVPTPAALLGSRMRASIPMTPRTVHKGSGNDFARQLAEQQQQQQQQQRPAKRFKSSAAPKGTKLASGYQDRTALRRQQEAEEWDEGRKKGGEEDGRRRSSKESGSIEQRLKALEEMVKLGQIDQGTFDKLRRELGVGGDLQSTHLVKGLDWDLLRRVKGGEDVSNKREEKEEAENTSEEAKAEDIDVDVELDRVLEEQVVDQAKVAPKEKKVKKGNLATGPPAKLSRNEILRQLKESRAAAAVAGEQSQPTPTEKSTLGSKFKKIHNEKKKPEKKRWIETDSSGRCKEILVITDAQGNTKRKVRWLDKEGPPPPKTDSNGLLLPDQNAKPLGMEVPSEIAAKIAAEEAAAAAQSEDEDIFVGAGTDYNPLADLDEADSSDEEKEEGELPVEKRPTNKEEKEVSKNVSETIKPRNYFGKTEDPIVEERSNPLTSDPTILAALKRAAALRQSSPSQEAQEDLMANDDVDPERLARRRKFLEEARRREEQDALDIDYGFGSSRIEDEEDEEGPTYDGQRGGGNKRKRGPKKRKGDKDSAADVLRVMEGRKQK